VHVLHVRTSCEHDARQRAVSYVVCVVIRDFPKRGVRCGGRRSSSVVSDNRTVVAVTALVAYTFRKRRLP